MYNLLEETKLIRQAQAGSKTACEQLLDAYKGLIKNMSRRYEYTPTGKIITEDAMGILHVAFMEAIRDFAPERGINFAAFLQSRLHGALYMEFKQACRDQERTAHPSAPPAEDCHDYFDKQESSCPTPERNVLAQAELSALLQPLSTPEKTLLHLLYIQELPQVKAAQLLHISPQALNKRKQNLIAKLRQLKKLA